MAAVCAASAAKSAVSDAALPSGGFAADAERFEKEGSVAVPPQAAAALHSNVIRNRFKVLLRVGKPARTNPRGGLRKRTAPRSGGKSSELDARCREPARGHSRR